MPLQALPLPICAPPAPGALPANAMAGLVGAIGDEGFSHRALAQLNGVLNAASWSVYQVWRTADGAPTARLPVLHLSASHGVPDTTQACFGAYRDGLYRRDRSFDALRGARAGHLALLRMQADEAPNAEHRDAIYRRHGVRERLSAVQPEADGSLLAVNLYHHEHQGRFEAGEVQRFADLAALLLAAVRRHIALAPVAAGRSAAGHADPNVTATATASARQRLQAQCPALTPRELDVCERLLRGWSFDGVAADLGLSVATVKTYRARAFERLGLHFRSELFARFGACPAA